MIISLTREYFCSAQENFNRVTSVSRWMGFCWRFRDDGKVQQHFLDELKYSLIYTFHFRLLKYVNDSNGIR